MLVNILSRTQVFLVCILKQYKKGAYRAYFSFCLLVEFALNGLEDQKDLVYHSC